MANSKTADPKVFPPPKTSHRATPQDQVLVYMLGFDQITPESFRVKLQAQVTLAGGRDAEGLPAGFFLNGILVGKTTCDEFGVADITLTIAWAALQQGKTLTVKVKGVTQAAPVKWDIPKSPMELEAEERERQERISAEQRKQQAEEQARQEKIRVEEQQLANNFVNSLFA